MRKNLLLAIFLLHVQFFIGSTMFITEYMSGDLPVLVILGIILGLCIWVIGLVKHAEHTFKQITKQQ